MTPKRIFAICVVFALAVGAFAIDAKQWRPRIDISSRDDGVKLDVVAMPKPGGQGYHASWYKTQAEKDRYLTFRKMLPTTDWTPIEFSFKSNKDTVVYVNLSVKYQGKEAKEAESACLVDAIEAEGADIANGSFEKTEEVKGGGKQAEDWYFQKKPERRAELISDASVAKDGENCVKVTAPRAVSQRIMVKADEPVKIKLWAKRVE